MLQVGILDYPNYNSSSSYFHWAMQTVVFAMIYIAITISLFSLMSSIGSERERFIPGYLKCFGLKDGVYNLSYFVFYMAQHMILTLIIIIVGYAIPGLQYFERTNVFVHFLNFFCFGFGMFGQAIMFAVLIRSALGANILAAFLFFFGLALALTATFMNDFLYGWWDPSLPFGGRIFLYIFYLFPFFHYLKACLDIAIKSVGALDSYLNVVSDPKGFTIHDLLTSPSPQDSVETTLTSMLSCVALGIGYYLIASYLDLVLYDNQGSRKSLLFFLKPSYWRSSPSPSNQSKHGIVVNNLSKRYGRGAMIVSDVSFQAFDGSVVVLLGRNGAGKSTIMNVMIGLTSPSRGTALMYHLVYGYDIVRDTAKIQSAAGVCLQTDVFWPELTAKEHLTIVCALKGIADIDEEVNAKLREVKLAKVANGQVQTFSGGMKRRLSVAMSMVGDPKIIMLDEPTTGIDVMNQKFLWEAINNLKRKGTLVLLITHSDEEASAVGDKIVLLHDGKIRAEGTPAKIQEQFRINTVSVLVDVSKSTDIKSEISRLLPDATILAENAGSIVFGFANAAQAPDLVSFLQQDASIKDWKISNSSIDTAFLVGTKDNIN